MITKRFDSSEGNVWKYVFEFEDAKKMEDEINAKFIEWNDALEKYGCRFVRTLLIDDNSIEPRPLIHSAEIVYKIKDRINGL